MAAKLPLARARTWGRRPAAVRCAWPLRSSCGPAVPVASPGHLARRRGPSVAGQRSLECGHQIGHRRPLWLGRNDNLTALGLGSDQVAYTLLDLVLVVSGIEPVSPELIDDLPRELELGRVRLGEPLH